MAKVITVGDEVYDKLKKIKRKQGVSFSKLLSFLVDFYLARRETAGFRSLAGVLSSRGIIKQRLRRVRNG